MTPLLPRSRDVHPAARRLRAAFAAGGAAALLATTLAACSSAQEAPAGRSSSAATTATRPVLSLPGDSPFPGGAVGTLNYGGGPLMTAPVNVYYIWYGGWSASSAGTQQILTQFAANVGGSDYLGVLATYKNANGVPATTQVHYAGSDNDAYSQGTYLDDPAMQRIVSRAITSGALPNDANGIYYVLTSADVAYNDIGSGSSFCSTMCGYHYAMGVNGTTIKYAFVGDPLHCAQTSGNCYAITSAEAPNGDIDADTMVNSVAHELAESITDPVPPTGYNQGGIELGDACAYYFDPYYLATGSTTELANLYLGGRFYLSQELYSNEGSGYCAMEGIAPPSCTVSTYCPTGDLAVYCDAPIADGDLQLQKNGVTIQTLNLQQAAETYSSWRSTGIKPLMTNASAGTASWRVCDTDGKGGLLCTPATTLTIPNKAECIVPKCPAGTHWCGADEGCLRYCY